jgi:hypothetical protein
MREYDPLKTPEPAQWLALDEAERIELIVQHHEQDKVKVPNLRAHAAIHAVVETQIAMGDELPVAATLARLQSEGLDRHDAVHAIGSALAEQLHGVASGKVSGDPNSAYAAALERLNAKSWRHAR